MGFEPVTFYIVHVHTNTVASLPTEPPKLYMAWSLFIAKSVQLFYLQCYYFFLNELEWMNNGIKLLHLYSIGLNPWRTIRLLCDIYTCKYWCFKIYIQSSIRVGWRNILTVRRWKKTLYLYTVIMNLSQNTAFARGSEYVVFTCL